MAIKIWGEKEQKIMDQFKKEIREGAQPEMSFDSIEESIEWTNSLRKQSEQENST